VASFTKKILEPNENKINRGWQERVSLRSRKCYGSAPLPIAGVKPRICAAPLAIRKNGNKYYAMSQTTTSFFLKSATGLTDATAYGIIYHVIR
jgi:hypothetical protein